MPGSLVEDVEERPAPLLMTTVTVAVFAPLSSFSTFAVLASLTMVGVPRLRSRTSCVWRGLLGGRCILRPCSHQLLQLAAVEPDVRSLRKRERRDDGEQDRASVNIARPTSP